MKTLFVLANLFLSSANADSIVHKATYTDGTTSMEGTIAQKKDLQGKVPGVLIVHDYMGVGKFSEDKAIQLAEKGYVAFAVDIYGKGNNPKDKSEAGQLAKKYKSDRALLRKRIRAAYDKMLGLTNVDKNKIAVIGYCFGGTTALELARSGANLVGTVSFHGGLSTPTPNDAKNIKGRVLVLHGANDPFVPPTEVEAFKTEMKNANVKMEFFAYPGAVHAFTNPAAGDNPKNGAAYNADADKQSWAELEKFLSKI